MRVLHVTQALGGVETHILGIVQHAADPTIHWALAAPEGKIHHRAQRAGMEVFPIPFVRQPSPVGDFRALLGLIELIRKWHPDVIHAHSAKGGFLGRLAGRLMGVPTAFTPNAFSFLGFQGARRGLYLLLERLAQPWTRQLIAVSASERHRAIEEVGFAPDQVVVVENRVAPVDDAFVRKSYRARGSIGMIGRLLIQKNPLMFLRVARIVAERRPGTQFILLGAGYHDDLRARLEEEVKRYGMQSEFQLLAWRGPEDLEAFYDALDVFVLTSQFEGLPYSLLEAMVRGIPAIGTNVDGIRDVIRDGTDGYVIAPDDAPAMADRIIAYLDNESLRRKFGMAGRSRVVKSFSFSDALPDVCAVYHSLVSDVRQKSA